MPSQDLLVFLPGLNNTKGVFDGVLRHLPPSVNAIALDVPALDNLPAITQALLAQLPPQQALVLVGFSFGGYVALDLLASYPQRVRALALVCTSPFADTELQRQRRHDALDQAAQGRYFEMIDKQASTAFHADSLGNSALMEQRRRMLRAYGPERFSSHVKAAIDRVDRSALLDGRHPVLMLAGSHDKLFGPELVQDYTRRIPGARFQCIEGAGHLLPMERPMEMAMALTDWLLGIESPSD